jgi:hypothetical protein
MEERALMKKQTMEIGAILGLKSKPTDDEAPLTK